MYDDLIRTLIDEWQSKIPPRDLIRREMGLDPKSLFDYPKKIVSVVGLRRVGKTYVVYQLASNLISSGHNVVYLNFEDERIPEDQNVLNSFLSVVKSRFPDISSLYVFLDEIHRIPNWSRWLRRVFDMEKPNIIITGSTSKLTSWEIPKELRGRSITLRVFPLRFSEYLKFKNIKVDYTAVRYSDSERAKLFSLFEEYLLYGGLPEVVLSPKAKKIMILQDYFNAIVLRDIIEQKRDVRDAPKIITLLKILVNSVYFSASRVERAMRSIGYRISKDIILEYKEYAEDAFFIETIPQLANSMKKQLLAPQKLYVADNGFITALSRHRVHHGRLLENLVYIELQRRYYGDPAIEIMYWQGKIGEVDFVVRSGFKVQELIQVCWDPTEHETLERELRSLRRLMKITATKKATIITGNYEDKIQIGQKTVELIPYWKWENQKPKTERAI